MSSSEKLPLSPMLVQYLAGLCVLKWGAAASVKEVVLGDMVLDRASGTRRDLDVTVTLNTPEGVYAFMGYEVKHEKTPLDISEVEQLATKLKDMPEVTHRAIVSTSGYTAPAITKAEHHKIDLYAIKEWTTPLEEQFPNLAPLKGVPTEVIKGGQCLLTWPKHHFFLTVQDAPDFRISAKDPLFDAQGKKHSLHPNYETFVGEMLARSTDILCPIDPVKDRVQPLLHAHYSRQPMPEAPQWAFGDTLGIASDEVYVQLAGQKLHRVWAVTIVGELRWEFHPWLYCAMEKVPTDEMLSGVVVANNPIPGRMFAVIVPIQGRTLEFRRVQLPRDQLNLIRDLKIAAAEDESPTR